jgi:transcriptional regulator with GAF, ATPase, and Fis domain
MTHALITPSAPNGRRFASAVGQVLGQQGITVSQTSDPAADPCAARILAIAKSGPDLAEEVGRVSEHGARRVLALIDPASGVTPDLMWTLLHHGASDVIVWDGPQTAPAVAARVTRWAEVETLLSGEQIRDTVVGQSPAWRKALRCVTETARWSSAPILVTGASGTGKELMARLIHEVSAPREGKQGRLVLIDATNVVPTLSGSEFFGHEQGAFTGAVTDRDGAFALADGGTLFLDEVGELAPALQAELLRVVQEGTYKRVGSNVWRRTSFRLVCATNRDLGASQRDGSFRSDFYHRIKACHVHLPTLEERRGDILPLFKHFLRQAGTCSELTPMVAQAIMSRSYPGNVRELRGLALSVSARHAGDGPITPGDLPEADRPMQTEQAQADSAGYLQAAVASAVRGGASLRQVRDAAADSAIAAALAQCAGKVTAAARMLGVSERALQLRRAGQRGVPAVDTNGDAGQAV